MKTLIVYSSKHGTTRRYAEALKSLIGGDVTLCNLTEGAPTNLSHFDTVVIGSPVYMGKTSKEVRLFCDRSMKTLLTKRLGLFICCWFEGAEATKQLSTAFSRDLLTSATASAAFGGVLDPAGMNRMDRFITAGFMKIRDPISHYSEGTARNFALSLK